MPSSWLSFLFKAFGLPLVTHDHLLFNLTKLWTAGNSLRRSLQKSGKLPQRAQNVCQKWWNVHTSTHLSSHCQKCAWLLDCQIEIMRCYGPYSRSERCRWLELQQLCLQHILYRNTVDTFTYTWMLFIGLLKCTMCTIKRLFLKLNKKTTINQPYLTFVWTKLQLWINWTSRPTLIQQHIIVIKTLVCCRLRGHSLCKDLSCFKVTLASGALQVDWLMIDSSNTTKMRMFFISSLTSCQSVFMAVLHCSSSFIH